MSLERHFHIITNNCDNHVFDQLILKCLLNEHSNLQYHQLMTKEVIWMKLKVSLGIEILQKIHWPTFMSNISNKRKWVFLAMFPLDLVYLFKPKKNTFFQYIFHGVCTTRGYVLRSEPETLRQSLNFSRCHFCIYQSAIEDEIKKAKLEYTHEVYC